MNFFNFPSCVYCFIQNFTKWLAACLIILKKGIRQGGPLSQYLFILCAKVLSCSVQDCKASRIIRGVKVVTRAPVISLLFFADDSVLFFKAKKSEAHAIQKMLKDYKDASGQAINFNKSLIYFSTNTRVEARTWACSLLMYKSMMI